MTGAVRPRVAPTLRSIEPIVVVLPREVPYLGPLGPGEAVNARGYLVRAGNRTIYPTVDRSVIVKATASDGTVGWGETYGIVAPRAVVEIIDDVLAPVALGRDPADPAAIWADLYDLMRVRGGSGGFYGDALAAIDIALWDLAAKLAGVPLCALLGNPHPGPIPAYVSGLPRASLPERVALAREWIGRGFSALKYAGVAASEGVVEEMRALREALPPATELMVDLHWRHSADEALALAHALAPYAPEFIEAPCAPEDIDGLARVARESPVPVAAGEEWHNLHEARWRLARGGLAYVQPEIAHTGVSQFVAIAGEARVAGARLAPHATIGVGIFLAASLHTTAALGGCRWHEYQPSVFDRNLAFVATTMRCAAGAYALPEGSGLGVEPRDALWQHALH